MVNQTADLETTKKLFHDYVKSLQNEITKALFAADPELKLEEDLWERRDHKGDPGGGGITRAFTGEVIENAGVNTSLVFGAIDPAFAGRLGGTGEHMWAAGISLIIHPKNPRIPTTHANFRMIHAGEKFWFGGGADLTPYYPHLEDFERYHALWEKVLSPYGVYENWKNECDVYFTNPHRNNEMRGIGGFFFDHFNNNNLAQDFNMIKDISSHFIESYFPTLNKRKNEKFDAEDEDFQLHRRGRYVEFNLLHDRGTMFGLRTNGRTDSILISLPGRVKFTYKYKPLAGSVHEKMMEYYYPREWN